MLPKVKIRKIRKSSVPRTPQPRRPKLDNGDEPEFLAGEVQGRKASMPEERFANALNESKAVDGFEFRYTVGAPRGLPGWKEIDYLVSSRGMVYAFEVDTAFTHRDKGRADVLHDAIVLKSLKKQNMNVYPQVIHLDGESDLVNKQNAKQTVRRYFE